MSAEVRRNGNRIGVTSNAGSETYTLDALNRLTAVTYPGAVSEAFVYDAAGNRTSHTKTDGTTVGYTVDPTGQLVSDTAGTTYTYDAAGNLASTSDGESYTYDDYGRHASISAGDVTQSYGYDATGTRVTVDGETQLWDRTGLPTLISTSAGDNYVHTAGIARDHDAWLLADAVGSVRATTDGTGAVTGTAGFTASGEQLQGATGTFGYAGEQHDPTGLIHLRARQYNPTLGRFTSVDPVQPGAPGTTGYNLYTYSGNNPTTWGDPSGQTTVVGYAGLNTEVAGRTATTAGGTGLLVASIFALAYSGIECTAELTVVGGEFLPGPCSFFDFDDEDEISDVLEYEDEETDPTKDIGFPEPDLTCSDAYPDEARRKLALGAHETAKRINFPNQAVAVLEVCDPATLAVTSYAAGQYGLSSSQVAERVLPLGIVPVTQANSDHAERKVIAGAPSAERLAIGVNINVCDGRSADCEAFLIGTGAILLDKIGRQQGHKGAIWPAK